MTAPTRKTYIDVALVAKWLRGWALSREKPAPEPIVGGWRVEVNEPDQVARYVFPRADETLQHLTQTIHPALTPIKVCAAPDEVAPLLTPPWVIDRTSPMMIKTALAATDASVANGYSVVVTGTSEVLIAFAVTSKGDIAAGGRAALIEDIAVFDRISTQEAHRRRGLGSAIMRALENAVAARDAQRGMLVATEAGCALYQTVGWEMYAPYTTAIVRNHPTHPNLAQAASGS